MVRHIVMWNYKEELSKEDRKKVAENMKINLEGLLHKVPGLLSIQVVDAPISSSTHDLALIIQLVEEDAIMAYTNHPDHIYVADTYVRPYVTDRVCLDYVEQDR